MFVIMAFPIPAQSIFRKNLKDSAVFSANPFISLAPLVTAGANINPNSSPASPIAFFIWAIAPAIVWACAAACPPNNEPTFLVRLSNRSVEFAAPTTSIPYLDIAFVEDPIVLPTKSAAAFRSIPFAAARSRVACVAAFIPSSSFINAARSACDSMIASSPNMVCCCNAAAYSFNPSIFLPYAAESFFSASSCCAARSIAIFFATKKAPPKTPAAIPAFLANPPSDLFRPFMFFSALFAPCSFTFMRNLGIFFPVFLYAHIMLLLYN